MFTQDAKVIVSTISEFFDSVAVLHAGAIPTCSGDAPNWWTWLFAPSATGGYAQSRRAQVLLPAAETFAAVASQLNPAFQFPANQLRDAYINNLYFEDHNLGAVDASGNAPFWSLKMGWVNAAGDTATYILGAAVDAIAGDIPTGSMPCVAVFNPLGWSRSVLTTLSLSVPLLASLGTFDVVDAETGLPLPVQRLQNAMLAFLAPDVPAVGYKVFRLVAHNGSFPPPGSLAGLQVQNESYTVHIDQATGSARSVIDRRSGRELVAADGAFNQYRFNNTFPPSGMSVVSSDSGRVLQSVTLRGNAQGSSSYQTTALLCAGLTRVEFYNTYDKLPPTVTESVDFAFHFSLPSPAMHYEIPFGAVRLFDDELSGFRSNHYAVRQWLSVAAGAGDYSATLAMDNATVTANPSGTFDGSVRMLISYTNSSSAYRAGIGPLSMNFSVSGSNGGFRPDSSTRAAYDFVAPAPVKILPAGQAGALDSVRLSFVSLDPSSILISTLKGAMDGNGIILRLYNPSTTALPVILQFAQAVQSAVETSLQEVDKFSLPFSGHAVSLSFDPFEVKTLRVRLTGPLAVADQADVTQVFALAQNFPNPFNGATTIRYTIASPAAVTLTIFDLLGRGVKVLARSARTPGAYSEAWDGRSADGRPVASGVYYYTLEARRTNGSTMRQTRAMVIIK